MENKKDYHLKKNNGWDYHSTFRSIKKNNYLKTRVS